MEDYGEGCGDFLWPHCPVRIVICFPKRYLSTDRTSSERRYCSFILSKESRIG